MRRRILHVALLLPVIAAAGCGASDAPPAPTPLPVAQISAISQLTLSECFFDRGSNTFTCDYSGLAQNIGAGCATAVTGVTKTYDANNHLLSASQWSYAKTVRPSEQFIYSAIGSTGTITVPPSPAAWSYDTSFAFTTIACP